RTVTGVQTCALPIFCRVIYNHRRCDAGCRSLSRADPRSAETLAGGIDRRTQRNGDQYRNLFAALSALLDDPAALLSCRVNLEFRSEERRVGKECRVG